MSTARAAGAAVGLVLAAAAATGLARGEEILYYVEEGQVVFTNTASHREFRPVPNLASVRVALPADLPVTRYDPYIRAVAAEENLDPSLIKAVALVESGFDAKAVSPKGARGLMQLMPGTAARYGVRDPEDPRENLRAGAQHLGDLLDEFHGDLELALAAYNAGAGAVRRYGGVPAFPETRAYVRKVKQHLSASPPRAPGARSVRAPVVLEENPDGTLSLTN